MSRSVWWSALMLFRMKIYTIAIGAFQRAELRPELGSATKDARLVGEGSEFFAISHHAMKKAWKSTLANCFFFGVADWIKAAEPDRTIICGLLGAVLDDALQLVDLDMAFSQGDESHASAGWSVVGWGVRSWKPEKNARHTKRNAQSRPPS